MYRGKCGKDREWGGGRKPRDRRGSGKELPKIGLLRDRRLGIAARLVVTCICIKVAYYFGRSDVWHTVSPNTSKSPPPTPPSPTSSAEGSAFRPNPSHNPV